MENLSSPEVVDPLETKQGYGFARLVTIPKNATICGISAETFHPYCSFAEVSILRILKRPGWDSDFVVESGSQVNIAGSICKIDLPIKQVNTESGVIIVNEIPFLVEDQSRGPRSIVRPLYLPKEAHKQILEIEASTGDYRFPRLEISEAQFARMTRDMFGVEVSVDRLLDVQNQFHQDQITIRIGDRFLNPRLFDLSGLSYNLRSKQSDIGETVNILQETYNRIDIHGNNSVEVLEYAVRVLKIRGFIYTNYGKKRAAEFCEESNLSEALGKLNGTNDITGLPFRLRYILMSQLSGYVGGCMDLSQTLIESFLAPDDFSRVKNWGFASIISLCSMIANNMGKQQLMSLSEDLLRLIAEKNATYSFIGLLSESGRQDLDQQSIVWIERRLLGILRR